MSYSRRRAAKQAFKDIYLCREWGHVVRLSGSLEAFVQATLLSWASDSSIRAGQESLDVARTLRQIESLRAEIDEAIRLYESDKISISTLAD